MYIKQVFRLEDDRKRHIFSSHPSKDRERCWSPIGEGQILKQVSTVATVSTDTSDLPERVPAYEHFALGACRKVSTSTADHKMCLKAH
jgi:hypothetical protein